MASFIFSKLKSPNKTPSKIEIEIENEDVNENPHTPKIIDLDDDDDNNEDVKNDDDDGDDNDDGVSLDDLNDVYPCVGQLFDSLDEAERFYRDYGRRIGFEVIIRTTHKRSKNKMICSRLYICRKGGRLASKSLDDVDEVPKKKRNRDSLGRTKCKARMYVVHRETSKKWEVTLVNLVHNHEMVSPSKVHFMQRPRNITPIMRELIIILSKSGIGPQQSLNVMGELTGSLENIGFTSQDIRNVLRDIRHHVFDSSDAKEGLTLLQELKCNSFGEFFYRVDVDEDNRVRSMLWVDPRSLNAYKKFGDVVVFDSTYRTNRYSMPFVPITGVNHHYQSILFGFALIRDEKEDSYIWVLKNWLEAIGNKPPISIITDQDIALGNAIAEVLPNTNHLYCTWHISTKFGEKLSGLYTYEPHFKEDFNLCLYKSMTVEQFENRWEDLVEKYNLVDHGWLQEMYSVRHKWVRVYTKLHFTTGITTTSRSESMNAFFDEYVKASTGLKEFIENSQKALEKQYLREKEADYETKQKERSRITSSSLENHAASTYTKEMFRRFQHELKQSGAYVVIEKDSMSTMLLKVYEAYKTTVAEESRKMYQITVANDMINCICRKFESSGMICRHIIRYLNMMQWTEIPSNLINLRWTIGANKVAGSKPPIIGNILHSQSARYTTLCKAFQDLAARGSCSIPRFKYVMALIEKEAQYVENFPKEMPFTKKTQTCEDDREGEDFEGFEDFEDFEDLKDPIISTTKGRKRERVKSGIEMSTSKKPRKCNFCKKLDANHDSRNCPKKVEDPRNCTKKKKKKGAR